MAARKDAEAEVEVRTCDNHPEVEAHLVSTLGGRIQEIALCKDCTPEHLEEFAGVR